MSINTQHPLIQAIHSLLETLAEAAPRLVYEGYILDDDVLCKTVYVVGWGEGRFVGCYAVGADPIRHEVVATDLAPLVVFFRFAIGMNFTAYGSHDAWKRWQAFREKGKGLLKVAGV